MELFLVMIKLFNTIGAECNDYPAANTYTIEGNQTRRGKGKGQSVTLKGRPSPFAFSGFRRPVQA